MLFLTGCICTKEVRYHEPTYYEFNVTKVELLPINKINPKEYVSFLDEKHKFVKMPTWFLLKMFDIKDAEDKQLEIYKRVYEWSVEDVERYNAFVKKQKEFFKNLNQ